jgi:hypothetical protein
VAKQHMMPAPSVDRRLLDNLRQARLGFEEIDLQIEELIAEDFSHLKIPEI